MKVNASPVTRRSTGMLKDHPVRFLAEHSSRKPRPETPVPPDDASAYIAMSDGEFVLVDAADFEWLDELKWRPLKVKGRTRYAMCTTTSADGKRVSLYMHRLIMDASPTDMVDHIDGNGLNNKRENLRFCTHLENHFNYPSKQHAVSQYKGVSWSKASGKWRARLRFNKKDIVLGYFTDEVEAAYAYDKAARELQGGFARLNFPLPGEVSAKSRFRDGEFAMRSFEPRPADGLLQRLIDEAADTEEYLDYLADQDYHRSGRW